MNKGKANTSKANTKSPQTTPWLNTGWVNELPWNKKGAKLTQADYEQLGETITNLKKLETSIPPQFQNLKNGNDLRLALAAKKLNNPVDRLPEYENYVNSKKQNFGIYHTQGTEARLTALTDINKAIQTYKTELPKLETLLKGYQAITDKNNLPPYLQSPWMVNNLNELQIKNKETKNNALSAILSQEQHDFVTNFISTVAKIPQNKNVNSEERILSGAAGSGKSALFELISGKLDTKDSKDLAAFYQKNNIQVLNLNHHLTAAQVKERFDSAINSNPNVKIIALCDEFPNYSDAVLQELDKYKGNIAINVQASATSSVKALQSIKNASADANQVETLNQQITDITKRLNDTRELLTDDALKTTLAADRVTTLGTTVADALLTKNNIQVMTYGEGEKDIIASVSAKYTGKDKDLLFLKIQYNAATDSYDYKMYDRNNKSVFKPESKSITELNAWYAARKPSNQKIVTLYAGPHTIGGDCGMISRNSEQTIVLAPGTNKEFNTQNLYQALCRDRGVVGDVSLLKSKVMVIHSYDTNEAFKNRLQNGENAYETRMETYVSRDKNTVENDALSSNWSQKSQTPVNTNNQNQQKKTNTQNPQKKTPQQSSNLWNDEERQEETSVPITPIPKTLQQTIPNDKPDNQNPQKKTNQNNEPPNHNNPDNQNPPANTNNHQDSQEEDDDYDDVGSERGDGTNLKEEQKKTNTQNPQKKTNNQNQQQERNTQNPPANTNNHQGPNPLGILDNAQHNNASRQQHTLENLDSMKDCTKFESGQILEHKCDPVVQFTAKNEADLNQKLAEIRRNVVDGSQITEDNMVEFDKMVTHISDNGHQNINLSKAMTSWNREHLLEAFNAANPQSTISEGERVNKMLEIATKFQAKAKESKLCYAGTENGLLATRAVILRNTLYAERNYGTFTYPGAQQGVENPVLSNGTPGQIPNVQQLTTQSTQQMIA